MLITFMQWLCLKNTLINLSIRSRKPNASGHTPFTSKQEPVYLHNPFEAWACSSICLPQFHFVKVVVEPAAFLHLWMTPGRSRRCCSAVSGPRANQYPARRELAQSHFLLKIPRYLSREEKITKVGNLGF